MNRRAPLARTLHVADWRRWQRAKLIVAVLLWIAALLACGGSEWDPATKDTANYPLAAALIILSALLLFNIEKHNRRLNASHPLLRR